PNSDRNQTVRVPGRLTHTRASLCAVLLALLTMPPERALVIVYSAPQLHSLLLVNSGREAERGWQSADADLVKAIVHEVRACSAPVALKFMGKD
ncbi:hypothetical protein SISNIDRAFT_383778, partial [Sistotremastrum niveocremeum HHB9708]